MSFIHDDFMLHGESARRLYHDYAAHEPILDYHTHLPPQDIANDRRFDNLFEIWLEGDHYKWRAMRANGVSEDYCTGKADPHEKFMAWSRTIPRTLRNPLYHWTHLELKRYFGVDELLNEESAQRIWEQAAERLREPDMTTQGILKSYKVMAVCTTDDPTDDLAYHKRIAESNPATCVYPTFRPDKAMAVSLPEQFNAWVDKLAAVTDVDMSTIDDLVEGLTQRHKYFHDHGCRLSDHGLPHCYAEDCDDNTANRIFQNVRSGIAASLQEQSQFASYLMLLSGRLDAQRRWTKQMHLGPLRNLNSRAFQQTGPDAGFDSMGDWPQAEHMARYLDRLDSENSLPKTIVYNINPKDNYLLASMIGNFQDGVTAGKMQFGSGWWYLDQKEGMRWQINALSNIGLLSHFVGMLTDSRSFMSCPRHEYFRRILCNMLGQEMDFGELPQDFDLIGTLVRDVCFHNAKRFFELKLPDGAIS